MTEKEVKQGLTSLVFNGDCLHHPARIVDNIFHFLKYAGYVKLAEDQTVWHINSTKTYKSGQEDLIKAGWRNVEL